MVADSIVGEIYGNRVYIQKAIAPCDSIETVSIMTGNHEHNNMGSVMVENDVWNVHGVRSYLV